MKKGRGAVKPEYVVEVHQLLGGLKRINDRYHASQMAIYRDMNRIDMSVLGFAAHPREMSIKDIRQRLNVPQSTLSSSISRLSKKGMIRRVINEQDSRSFHLVLTESGQRLSQAHEDVNKQLATDMLDRLDSDDEREFLIRLLAKVVGKMT
jgi:DNA-binding MarR family transcriptional regulator